MYSDNSKIQVTDAYKIYSLVRKKILSELLQTVSIYLLILTVLLTAVTLVEMRYNLNRFYRTAVFYLILISIILFIVLFLKRVSGYILKYNNYRRNLVASVDNDAGGSKILLLYDLLKFGRVNDIVDAAVSEVRRTNDFKNNIPDYLKYRYIPYAYSRLIFSLILLIFLLTVSPVYDSALRIVYHNRDFLLPPDHSLKMETREILVPENDSVIIKCSSSGNVPDALTFRKHSADGSISSLKSVHEGDGLFVVSEPAVRSFICYFESAEAVSDTCSVNVLQRPEIEKLSVKVISPRYTRIPDKEFCGIFTGFSAYRGSLVLFLLEPDAAGSDSAFIEFSDGTMKKMLNDDSGQFRAEMRITKPSEFQMRLYRNSNGVLLTNQSPVVQKIDVINDEYPFVNIIYPEEGMLLDESMNVPVFATASDDFEISKIEVHLRKISRSDKVTKELKFTGDRDGITVVNTYVSCEELDLLPEDKVELFLRVYDNDNVSGPKFTDSNIRIVVLPSVEQLFARTEKNYETQKNTFTSELERNKTMLEKLNEMTEKLKKNQDMSWEDKKKLDQILNEQDNMNRSLHELEEEIESNISVLDENSLLSEETMNKYLKLQDMVDDLFSKDIKDKLKKLSEVAERDKFDKNAYSEMLKNFEEQQEQFREGLEKSIEILQQIKNEYLVDRLIKQIDDLITVQNEINFSIKDKEFRKETQLRKEDNIEESFRYFEKELENSVEELGGAEIRKIVESTTEKNIPADISEIKTQIGKDQKNSASKTGTVISAKMTGIKNDLTSLKAEMLEEQKNELQQEIGSVISDLLDVSSEIENIKNFSKDLPPESGHSSKVIRDFSRIGMSLETAGNRIFSISKKTFFIDKKIIAQVGNIIEQHQKISKAYTNRLFSFSYENNIVLMGSVNRLALLLADASAEMDSSASPSGLDEMLKKMEDIAAKQAGLNMQTLSMSGSENPGMSQMQDMMSRLAMEQSQLYDALMKMQSGMNSPGEQGDPGSSGSPGEGLQPGGTDGKGIPGSNGQKGNSGAPVQSGQDGSRPGERGLGKRLGNIGSEMKEIEKQLQDKKLDESLLVKQDRVLDKLLDAIESVKREKVDRKRESRSGNLKAVDPGSLDIQQENNLKEMLLRSLKDGYSNEFKIKIKKYFRELEN